MGINGQRLDRSQMAARGYTLSANDFHIIVEIPVGSPDGYYKVGKCINLQCKALVTGPFSWFIKATMNNCRAMPQITSTTSPIVWRPCWRYCGGQRTPKMIPNTRFCSPSPPLWCPEFHRSKMVSPTSLIEAMGTCSKAKPVPLCSSDTVPEDRMFTLHLGTFLHDVVLSNITFSTGVLTVEEIRARGFFVQEHRFSNGSKSFSLQVPFDADVVLKHVCNITITFRWSQYCCMCLVAFCSWSP